MAVKLAYAIAAAWGFAEATLFFLVPDIWLSIIGRNNLRRGLYGCCFALGGAIIGGVLMYWWGALAMDSVVTVVNKVPAINEKLLENARLSLDSKGWFALFLGPLQGVPYKAMAVQAHTAGLSPVLFFLISIPARMIRFLVVTITVHYLSRAVVSTGIIKETLPIICVCWVVFYYFYFRAFL